MKAEFKTPWLEALRSGAYRQGIGQLRTPNDEFCCLGVLQDVCGRAGSPVRESESMFLLDDEAAIVLGLTYTDQKVLSDMNDNGNTFAEIADYIEATL